MCWDLNPGPTGHFVAGEPPGLSPGFNSRDFNIIVHPSKSSSYNGFQGLTSEVKEFFECIHQIAIFDHAYIGLLFTWSNR